MKTNLTFRISFLMTIVMLLWNPAQAQFETYFGVFDGSEDMADTRILANGHTIVLANTTSYGPQKILLAELSETGEVLWYRTIQDAVDSDMELTGKSIELALDSSGVHIGYFITGCRGNYLSQLTVIRTDLTGTPGWNLTLYNTERRDTLEECGVSLERQGNGDIIVVGTSANYSTGNNRFIAARLSLYGEIRWCYRYGSVQGLQFYPNESCNGLRNSVPVVAIVGHVHENGQGHTFVSCIQAGSGLEVWRRRYDSNGFHDDGNDIVQNPANQRFRVVGQIDSLGGSSGMWVFNANVLNGTLIDGSAYRFAGGSLVATDVTLGFPTSSAMIVGRRDSASVGPLAFAMRLPFAAGAIPVWSYNYGYSSPNVLGDDAVDRSTSVPGSYVLGSVAVEGYLYVAAIGAGGDPLCSGVPFESTVTPTGHSESLNKHRSSSNVWIQNVLQAEDQEFVQFLCWPAGTEFGQQRMEETPTDLVASIFPNPIYAGDLIHVQVDLPEASEVSIQLLDSNNRSHGNWREYREAGTQDFTMRIPSASFPQVYFVRITLSDGQQKIIKVVANS